MRTFAQKPKVTQQTRSTKSTKDGRTCTGQSREISSTFRQSMIGHQAAGRLCQKAPLGSQPKLTISVPGDIFEQEADRVADQVMRMPVSAIQRQIDPQDKMVRAIQTKKTAHFSALPPQAAESPEAPPIVQDILAATGHPLASTTRAAMELRFGHDFSHVRIHTNAKATESANRINAAAYTSGQNVVFNVGRYAPGTAAGDHLLAHELTHTLQQGRCINTIQRSLKFEFQTENRVWAVKDSGSPDPKLLPRKYAPTSKGFGPHAGEERGNRPAYLATGHKGTPAKEKGDVQFVEVQGPRVTEKATSGVDKTLGAEFVLIYQFNNQIKLDEIIDQPAPSNNSLKLIDKTDNPKILSNENTFEYRYINADGTQLDIHLGEDHRFKKGHVKLMRVGRGERKLDATKAAQFIEIWKITLNPIGDAEFLGNKVSVERVSVIDNAKDKKMKGSFNKNTWNRRYFWDSDIVSGVTPDDSKSLPIHRDNSGRFQHGEIDFMKKETLLRDKEQTAIELQSEEGGFLEFETPKWFRKWSDIEERITEAKNMIDAMNDNIGTNKEIIDKKTLETMKKKGLNSGAQVKVVEWPAEYSTDHLKNLRKDKRRLLVEIIDEMWHAKIQSSEGIALSEFSSLQKEHMGVVLEKAFSELSQIIFSKAFAAAKAMDATLKESTFADMKGFLQLIITYIFRGQVRDMSGKNAKEAFTLMARTDFGSMFELLSEDEKSLFKMIVNDSSDPILKVVEGPVNIRRREVLDKQNPGHTLAPITLTRDSYFFFRKIDKKKETVHPKIHNWLVKITKGKDLLKGRGISDAMGAKSVDRTPDTKDFGLAKFEVRSTRSHEGSRHPSTEWIKHAKNIFDGAAARSADTPNDPTTPRIDESSKTSLRK